MNVWAVVIEAKTETLAFSETFTCSPTRRVPSERTPSEGAGRCVRWRTCFRAENEERKKDYYKALMTGQKNRYKKNEKIDQWEIFFLNCMTSLISKLEKKYESYSKKGAYLNDRQKKIINVIKKQAPVKLADVLTALPDVPRNTLKKDLLYLVQQNSITKMGQGRSTVYRMKE